MSRLSSQDLIDEIDDDCNRCYNATNTSDDFFDDWVMTQYWIETHVYECLTDVKNAMTYTNNAIRYLISYSPIYTPKYTIPYWMQHFGGGEITIVDLIAAYIDAEDDHRSAWQLLTDAYKASMYDKPFDLEYHKTWVQRFMQWR